MAIPTTTRFRGEPVQDHDQQPPAELDEHEAPDAPESSDAPVMPDLVLRARNVQITGSQGVAVDGLDIDLPVGGLGVLQGPDGSGKTCALLALAGRMPIHRGELEVAGHALPRHRGAIQRSVSLAEVTGVNDLDDALTVSAHIAERLASQTLLPWASRASIQAVMDSYTSALVAARRYAPVQSPRSQVGPDWWVGDLTGVERTLLGVALALIGSPAVVAVDENGELRSREDRRAATAGVGYLMRAARTPFAVLTTSTEAVDPGAIAEITGLPASMVHVTDLGRRSPHATSEADTRPLVVASEAAPENHPEIPAETEEHLLDSAHDVPKANG